MTIGLYGDLDSRVSRKGTLRGNKKLLREGDSLQKNRIEIVRITGLPVLSMGPTFVHGFTYCDYPG